VGVGREEKKNEVRDEMVDEMVDREMVDLSHLLPSHLQPIITIEIILMKRKREMQKREETQLSGDKR